MFVIMAVATDTRAVGQAAALAIGATVGLEALFAGPISGASMNPARSLGPALVAGVATAQWVYLTAPFVGAVAAALLYRWLREGAARERRTAPTMEMATRTTEEEALDVC
jgi:glycerol uptake facilitator-like aquaporin